MLLFFLTIFQYFFIYLFFFLLFLFRCSFSSFLLVVVIKAHFFLNQPKQDYINSAHSSTRRKNKGSNRTFRESHTKSVSPSRVTRAVCLNSKSPRRVSCRQVSSSYLIDNRSSTIRETPYATSRKFRPTSTYPFALELILLSLSLEINANNQRLPYLLSTNTPTI